MGREVTDQAVRQYRENQPRPEDQLRRVIPGVDPWPISGDVDVMTANIGQLPASLTPGGNLPTAIEEFGASVPMARLAEQTLLELQIQSMRMMLLNERHDSHRAGFELR